MRREILLFFTGVGRNFKFFRISPNILLSIRRAGPQKALLEPCIAAPEGILGPGLACLRGSERKMWEKMRKNLVFSQQDLLGE